LKVHIPFLTTSIETDLMIGLVGTPLWWVLGFNIFIYHFISFLVIVKILSRQEPLKVSKPIIVFFVFCVFYLASIGINVGVRPMQRIFASLNNFSFLVLGLFIMIGVYNSDPRVFFRKFLKGGRALCIITSLLGAVFVGMWAAGIQDVETPSLLGRLVPKLMNLPYFFNLLMLSHVMVQRLLGDDAIRLTIYSAVPTATGGFMLVLIPLMMAHHKLEGRRRWTYPFIFVLAVMVLVLSLSRSAIYGFVFAGVVVFALERGIQTRFAIFGGFLGLTFSGVLMRGIEWILNARKSSTVGRLDLYEQAIRILLEENPLMGIGVHLRDDFTMTAIGSHSLYIEILFVSGFIGFPIFLLYQAMVLKGWLNQKRNLPNRTVALLWRYLGMSLIALSVWVITDTLLGLPFTTYAYYLIAGAILLLSKSAEELPEDLFQEGELHERPAA
jgi:hypothetical protein